MIGLHCAAGDSPIQTELVVQIQSAKAQCMLYVCVHHQPLTKCVVVGRLGKSCITEQGKCSGSVDTEKLSNWRLLVYS